MKNFLIITFSLILVAIIVLIAIILGSYFIDSYRIANDPTLYQGFKIIEEKQITAEDGMTFYTIQVDMNHPKTPYRLYVFSSEKMRKHILYVDLYTYEFEPNVNFIMSSKTGSYYEVGDTILNYYNGEFRPLASGYLENFENTEEDFTYYVPVVRKLIEKNSWFWLYEGAEFLLKSDEKEYMLEVLRTFESNNQDKTEYSEPCHRLILTYETMVEKCNELLQKYGGE